jgi:hypothetical protein
VEIVGDYLGVRRSRRNRKKAVAGTDDARAGAAAFVVSVGHRIVVWKGNG